MAAAPNLVGSVVAPLVNPNEPEAQVVELPVSAYAPIARGDLVCVLETSKSTEEVTSEHEGWVGPLHVALYDRVAAGDPICEVYDAEPPRDAAPDASGDGAAAGLRLTRKAEAMAREAGVDLSGLPSDRFITERDIRELIARSGAVAEVDPGLLARAGARSVVVFGGGGHGASLIEAMRREGALDPLCVVDDGMAPGEEVLGVPVAGGRGALAPLAEAGAALAVNGVGAIGRMQARIDVSEALAAAGLSPATVVDPSAAVAPSATLHAGAQVMARAVVWSRAEVGAGAIVNTSVVVSHDCRLGAHCHVAPGAVLAGDVSVGEGALVGMGVTVSLGLRVGARAIVGNGAVVTADVPDGTIVSAGSVWPA